MKTYSQIASVKLISVSKPAIAGLDTPSDLVAYCARVSNPANQHNSGERLIKYLKDHKHWSPFEMVSICMEIITTRDIARQILRHRSFSFQEFSQRYAVATDFCLREPRLQDATNRQNSIPVEDSVLHGVWETLQKATIRKAINTYNRALELGIAKEQARSVLPEGNTVSRLYMNGTLRSWLHYVDARCSPDTQAEHRLIASKCSDILYSLENL